MMKRAEIEKQLKAQVKKHGMDYGLDAVGTKDENTARDLTENHYSRAQILEGLRAEGRARSGRHDCSGQGTGLTEMVHETRAAPSPAAAVARVRGGLLQEPRCGGCSAARAPSPGRRLPAGLGAGWRPIRQSKCGSVRGRSDGLPGGQLKNRAIFYSFDYSIE